jgi:hypothetical protein
MDEMNWGFFVSLTRKLFLKLSFRQVVSRNPVLCEKALDSRSIPKTFGTGMTDKGYFFMLLCEPIAHVDSCEIRNSENERNGFSPR